ncbi:Uncharacterised protein [Actinobacillus pleuropneumoniae]|nr:Uncharacterised protein [Actinobacillus pleuropneumoniae]
MLTSHGKPTIKGLLFSKFHRKEAFLFNGRSQSGRVPSSYQMGPIGSMTFRAFLGSL